MPELMGFSMLTYFYKVARNKVENYIVLNLTQVRW